MRTLYQMEYDENTGKIITDEFVESERYCHSYYFAKPGASGYGELATSRKICIKKLISRIRKDVKDKEKELNKAKKTLKYLEGIK